MSDLKEIFEKEKARQISELEEVFANPTFRKLFDEMNADVGATMDEMDKRLEESKTKNNA